MLQAPMYESRSATFKMILSEAPKSRQINGIPAPYKEQATSYRQTDFTHQKYHEKTSQVPSCLRIAKAIFLGDVAVGKTCIINR